MRKCHPSVRLQINCLTVLFLILAVLEGLDIVTTHLLFQYELNPVMLWFHSWLGWYWWTPKAALFLILSVGMIRLAKRRGVTQRVRNTLAGAVGGMTVVVLINLANVAAETFGTYEPHL